MRSHEFRQSINGTGLVICAERGSNSKLLQSAFEKAVDVTGKEAELSQSTKIFLGTMGAKREMCRHY